MSQVTAIRRLKAFSIDIRPLGGGSYRLSTSQIVSATPSQVFPFFENPGNLSDITPPWLDFKLINSAEIVRPRDGARYDYTIRWFGIRIHWQSEIVDYEPPHRFIDVQLKGPYALWHHLHTFEEVADGTLMKDDVTYRLPFGPLGRITHILAVKKQLRDIFIYRAVSIDKWINTAFLIGAPRHF